MPTIEEFKQFAVNAREAAEDYKEWADDTSSEVLRARYLRCADNRLDDARFYERQAKEMQERHARKSERILAMISEDENEEDASE